MHAEFHKLQWTQKSFVWVPWSRFLTQPRTYLFEGHCTSHITFPAVPKSQEHECTQLGRHIWNGPKESVKVSARRFWSDMSRVQRKRDVAKVQYEFTAARWPQDLFCLVFGVVKLWCQNSASLPLGKICSPSVESWLPVYVAKHTLPLTIQNSKGSPERHSKTDPTQVDTWRRYHSAKNLRWIYNIPCYQIYYWVLEKYIAQQCKE